MQSTTNTFQGVKWERRLQWSLSLSPGTVNPCRAYLFATSFEYNWNVPNISIFTLLLYLRFSTYSPLPSNFDNNYTKNSWYLPERQRKVNHSHLSFKVWTQLKLNFKGVNRALVSGLHELKCLLSLTHDTNLVNMNVVCRLPVLKITVLKIISITA